MTLPASGIISARQVQQEYAAPAGTGLRALVRSGAYVPNTAPNAGVPTAPPISVRSFYGGQAGTGGGGGSPLAGNKSGDASGSVFAFEPAAGSALVTSNTVTILASGGTGSYSYNWAYVSGDATTAIGGGTTGASKSWSRTVSKNNTNSSVWRCTISDGVSSVQVNVSITLTYQTDL